MLVGTASVDDLAVSAANLTEFSAGAVQFDDVMCFQVIAEMRNQAREAILPPGLHPTVPAALSLQVWRVGDSPWGAFNFALCRVSCRSGVRARGMTTAAYVTTEAAASNLASTFGYPARIADIGFQQNFDSARFTVSSADHEILDITCLDPQPLGLNDVQYTGTLNLAQTPLGLRLVQLEEQHQASRVERLNASLRKFDAAAWGNPLLDPYWIVASSLCAETIVCSPIRFVCRPDELAFTGTEAVAGSSRG